MPAQLENSNLQALPVILSWTHYERDLKVGKITHQDVGQMDMYVILPTEEELANEIKKQREIYLDSTS